LNFAELNSPFDEGTSVQISQVANRMRIPLLSRGGVDARIKKDRRSLLIARSRGGVVLKTISRPAPPRPLPSKEAVAIFSWCRGHPSSAEEGNALTIPSRIRHPRNLHPVCVSSVHVLLICLVRKGISSITAVGGTAGQSSRVRRIRNPTIHNSLDI